MSRRDYQVDGPGRYRSQIAHPTRPNARLSLRASTPGELRARIAYVHELRRDVAMGIRAPGDVDTRIRALTGAGAPPTVAQLCEAWRKGLRPDARPKAESAYRCQIAPLGNVPWWGLTADVLRQWYAELLTRYAPKTAHSAYAQLAAAFGLALDAETIDALPWGRWRPPPPEVRRRREATRDVGELVRLIEAAHRWDRKHGPHSDMAARVTVMALCALRQGEAAALGWDDLDPARGVIHLRHNAVDGWRTRHPEWTRPSDPPKNGAAMLRLHPDAADALDGQRERLRGLGILRPDGPVFPNMQPNKLGAWRDMYRCIRPKHFGEVVRLAGLPNPERWDVHSLRHSGATLETAHSSPMAALARTRHASLEQLQQYAHGPRELPPSAIPRLQQRKANDQ